MVTVYGMSDKLGPISLSSNENEYEMQMYGENIGDVVGQEVKKIIDTAYVNAQAILSHNMDILHAMANRLLEKEKITSEEYESIFN